MDSHSSAISGGRLQQRRKLLSQQSSNKRETTKVLNELEMIGVKPTATVTKAVTFIDSWALFTGR
jgi:hypothetical protein